MKQYLTAQGMNMREAVDNSRNRRIWRSLVEASSSANAWRRRNWMLYFTFPSIVHTFVCSIIYLLIGWAASLAPSLSLYAIHSSHLVFKSQLGLASKYLCDLILHPLSPTSQHPLRSSDRPDLFVPCVRALLFLNSDPMHASVPLRGIDFALPSYCLMLKSCFFFWGCSVWEPLWKLMLREALYKWSNTIQCLSGHLFVESFRFTSSAIINHECQFIAI